MQIVKPRDLIASVDARDACYSVPVHEKYQRYLKFLWGYPVKFTVKHNDFGPVMRVFMKVLKLLFAFLRSEGHFPVMYVDYCYLNPVDLAELVTQQVKIFVLADFWNISSPRSLETIKKVRTCPIVGTYFYKQPNFTPVFSWH